MKALILEIFSFPAIIFIIYFLGYFSTKIKNKLKLYSYALFLLLFFSLPVVSNLTSLPLLSFQKKLSADYLSEASAVFVLTGGIKKNILGDWQPSEATLERVLVGNKVANDISIPLIISGGRTSTETESEAFIVRNHLNLYDSIIEQESLNTYESAINLKPFCAKFGGKILLITSELHSLRSYLTFKTQKCNTFTFAYQKIYNEKNIFSAQHFKPSLEGLSNMNAVIYEYLALVYYLITYKINLFI